MDDGSSRNPTSDADAADEAIRSVFPDGVPPALGRVAKGNFPILSSEPLTEADLLALKGQLESGTNLGVTPPLLQRASTRHHRAAQFIAMGMEDAKVRVLCNYSEARLSILKSDPMFQEAIFYYAQQVEAEFVGVAEKMAELTDDLVEELVLRLERTPEAFTISQINELIKTLSDRSGNGPTTKLDAKVVHAVVTAEELARIRNGTNTASGDERQARALSEENRRVIEGVFAVTARDVSAAPPPQLSEEEGAVVGGEGCAPFDEDDGGELDTACVG